MDKSVETFRKFILFSDEISNILSVTPQARASLAPPRQLPSPKDVKCSNDSANYWREMADNMISLEGERFSANPLVALEQQRLLRNTLITNAYAKLYLQSKGGLIPGTNQKQFYWLGLAAYASAKVGRVMQGFYAQGNGLELKSSSYGTGLAQLTSYLSQSVGNGLVSLESEEFNRKLGDGNRAIFNDIFWEYLAYSYCGGSEAIQTISKLLQQTKSTVDKTKLTRELKAWREIDEAERSNPPNSTEIKLANMEILRVEQENVLQPVIYDGVEGSLGGYLFKAMAEMPIKKADFAFPNFNQYSPQVKASKNFSNFNDRWSYVSNGMNYAMSYMDTARAGQMEQDLENIIKQNDTFFSADFRK